MMLNNPRSSRSRHNSTARQRSSCDQPGLPQWYYNMPNLASLDLRDWTSKTHGSSAVEPCVAPNAFRSSARQTSQLCSGLPLPESYVEFRKPPCTTRCLLEAHPLCQRTNNIFQVNVRKILRMWVRTYFLFSSEACIYLHFIPCKEVLLESMELKMFVATLLFSMTREWCCAAKKNIFIHSPLPCSLPRSPFPTLS